MYIKTGVIVMVIAGKEKGEKGRVIRVLREKGRVVVEGRNLVRRHQKPNPLIGREGGIIETEASIHASNVMLYSEKLQAFQGAHGRRYSSRNEALASVGGDESKIVEINGGPVRVQRRFVGADGTLFATGKEAMATFPEVPKRVRKVRFSPRTGEIFE